MIVSYTAAISVEPVAPVPLGTVGSSPVGSENWAKTSVPPTRGCSVVVTFADDAGRDRRLRRSLPAVAATRGHERRERAHETTKPARRCMATLLSLLPPMEATRAQPSVGTKCSAIVRSTQNCHTQVRRRNRGGVLTRVRVVHLEEGLQLGV